MAINMSLLFYFQRTTVIVYCSDHLQQYSAQVHIFDDAELQTLVLSKASVNEFTRNKFQIITEGGDRHLFQPESKEDFLRWIKCLEVLVFFPYSAIPEEPAENPVTISFHRRLDCHTYQSGRCIYRYL